MSDNKDNIFRKFQKFLTDHGDHYDTVEAAMADFFKLLQEEGWSNLSQDDLPQVQSIDLVEKSFYAKNEKNRLEMLEAALELWPDNLDAKLHLIDEANPVDYLNELESLWKEASKKVDFSKGKSWQEFNQRPYWRLSQSLAISYNAFGILKKAEEMYDYILKHNPDDPMNARYDLMSIYCRTYNWPKAMDMFLADPANRQIDQMLIPLLVLAILLRKEELAKDYMNQLVFVSPDIDLFLDDDEEQFDFDMIVELSQSDNIEINSLESSARALAPLINQIARTSYVYSWFANYFDGTELVNLSDKVISISFPRQKLAQIGRELGRIFHGIGRKQADILKAYGLLSKEDFLHTKEEEILALKHIGPATIRRLRENGVRFMGDPHELDPDDGLGG